MISSWILLCIELRANPKSNLIQSLEIVQTPRITSDNSKRVKISKITKKKNGLSILGNVPYL